MNAGRSLRKGKPFFKLAFSGRLKHVDNLIGSGSVQLFALDFGVPVTISRPAPRYFSYLAGIPVPELQVEGELSVGWHHAKRARAAGSGNS